MRDLFFPFNKGKFRLTIMGQIKLILHKISNLTISKYSVAQKGLNGLAK